MSNLTSPFAIRLWIELSSPTLLHLSNKTKSVCQITLLFAFFWFPTILKGVKVRVVPCTLRNERIRIIKSSISLLLPAHAVSGPVVLYGESMNKLRNLLFIQLLTGFLIGLLLAIAGLVTTSKLIESEKHSKNDIKKSQSFLYRCVICDATNPFSKWDDLQRWCAARRC